MFWDDVYYTNFPFPIEAQIVQKQLLFPFVHPKSPDLEEVFSGTFSTAFHLAMVRQQLFKIPFLQPKEHKHHSTPLFPISLVPHDSSSLGGLYYL